MNPVSRFSKARIDFSGSRVPNTPKGFCTLSQNQKEIALQELIGALSGEWFYLYPTSYPSNSDLSVQIDELFQQLKFTP